MTDEHRDSASRRRGELTTDALLAVFSDVVRRTVLFHLRQHGAARLEELVDVLAQIDEYDVGEDDRESIQTALLHVHLPKLEEKGLVTYDPDERVVETANLPPEVGEWLDLVVKREVQFDSDSRTSEDRIPAAEGEPIRVLVVDDEPGLAEVIANYIEHETDDMAVTPATSAPDAVAALDDDPAFDCIVSDYKMPGLSGLDFLKAVREHDPGIPFIIFTGKGSETTASRAIESGVTHYLPKGSDTDQYDKLIERIRSAIDRD